MRLRLAGSALLLGLAGCGQSDPDCEAPGTICTWAGSGLRAFDGDGRDRRDTALYWPVDLEVAPDGRAYLVDWQNHRIRRVEADGRVRTVVGGDLPGDGPVDQSDTRDEGAPGTLVELNHPTDLAFLADGRMLIAAWHNHKIRRFDPATGRVQVLCGSGPGDTKERTLAARALLNQPKSVAVDTAGRVYVADSRNQRLRQIDETGVLSSVAGTGTREFSGDGGPPLMAAFHMQQSNENPEPGGSIALDQRGRIYLADTFNNRIRRIDLEADTVETVAGNGTGGYAGDGGPALAAALNRPRDLEIGPDGRLYVADTDNHRIRVVDLATGIIETVVGGGGRGFAGDGGRATAAALDRPFGVALDPAGNVFVADTFNDRIRRVAAPARAEVRP